MQEQDDEAHERDLRHDIQPAGGTHDPQPSVTHRPLDIRGFELVLRARPENEHADERADEDERGEEQESRSRISEKRDRDGGDQTSDRHRGLPHPERQPSLVSPEPARHRPAAAGLHAAAECTAQHEQSHERGEVGRERRTRKTDATPHETHRQRPALAEAVGREPPRQQREREPDPLGGEHHTDLREAQVVLLPKGRREHRDREGDRREARLRRGSGGEHRPPIARAGYSPKGLIGRAPVETITLFVSR